MSAAVALAAGGAAPGSPAIRVLAGGARAAEEGVAEPIIFIHPASGDSADYAPLVARLSWPGPVVGIDAAGLRAGSDGVPAARVQEMAASYLARLAISPRFLLGSSVGGVIAAEMSQQLVDAGREVRFLGLFDCHAPQPEMRRRPTDDATMARAFASTTARTRGRELTRPPTDPSPPAILRSLRDAAAAPPDWTAGEVARRLALFTALTRAHFAHDQRHLSTRVHLFEAESDQPSEPRPAAMGWDQHSDVVRIAVPGTRFAVMAPEHAPRLAALVGPRLTAAA